MIFLPFYCFGLFLWIGGPSEFDYVVYYAAICLLLILIIASGDVTDKILGSFLFLYLSIALLNISSYRGYVTSETASVVFFYVLAVAVPACFSRIARDAAKMFGGRVSRSRVLGWRPEAVYEAGLVFWLLVALHLVIVWVVLAYVMGTTGNTFLNAELRFRIPNWAAYVIRSSCVVPVAIYALHRPPRGRLVLALASVSPAILIGARGTVVLFICAAVLVVVMAKAGGRGRWRIPELLAAVPMQTRILSAAFVFVVIASGFYLRRSGNSTLVTARQLIDTYFDYSGVWLYVILPFYQGFRETIGVTNQIILRGLENSSGSILFVKELGTVLPGEHVAPGQYLGDVIGRVGDGGLTPGLIGGTYIDLGVAGSLVFLLLWLGARLIYGLGRKDPRLLILYAVYLTQLMHLFHRGFLKVEYLTFILITASYLLVVKGRFGVRMPRRWHHDTATFLFGDGTTSRANAANAGAHAGSATGERRVEAKGKK